MKSTEEILTTMTVDKVFNGEVTHNRLRVFKHKGLIDHIIPKSKGGNKHLNNLQPMCCNCNLKKGNKIEDNYKEGKT